MFAEHTQSSILALACIDKGVTDAEKNALQLLLLGKHKTPCAVVVKYKDAASRLGLSIPTIKRLVAEGRLTKVHATSTKRACGVTEESLNAIAS